MDEASVISGEQEELAADVAAAQAYGEAHPDEFGGAGYGPTRPATVRAWFTGSLGDHEAALRALVDHADRLQVCPTPVSEREADRIQGEIQALMSSEGSAVHRAGYVPGQGVVVDINASRRDLADQLRQRYGSAVVVSLGALPYPPPAAHPDLTVCPDASPPTPVSAGIALGLAPLAIPAGTQEAVLARLRAVNGTDATVEIGDIRFVEVLDVEGSTVGVTTATITTELRSHRLEPGGALDLDLFVPLESCRFALGYTLPPGAYTMRAVTLQGTVDAPLELR